MVIWKEIHEKRKCFNYEISDMGEVRNKTSGKTLKGWKNQNGYIIMYLKNDEGKTKGFGLHVLLAEAFHPNPENKPVVDHINRDKNDNRLENLRWATLKENANNCDKTRRGPKRGVVQMTRTGQIVNTFSSIDEAGKHVKLYPGNISKMCSGKSKSKTCGGFVWKYSDVSTSAEVWKDLTIEGRNIEVSDHGHVRFLRCGSLYTTKGFVDTDYHRVTIRGNNGDVKYPVHRLVMKAFSPIEDETNMVVDHLDKDKTNNKLTNLEWVTKSENTKRGSGKKIQKIDETGKIVVFTTIKDAAKDCGVPTYIFTKKYLDKETQYSSV
jgi:predicted SAM-dependent methyltransferase